MAKARLNRRTGKWEMTRYTNTGFVPCGYCQQWHDWASYNRGAQAESYAAHLSNRPKFHTDGHTSQEEATECFRKYLLDYHLKLGQRYVGIHRPCLVCRTMTDYYAEIIGLQFPLCREHQERHILDGLLKFSPDADIHIY